ncbi:MAG TPA: phospholipase D family protein [Variovorax sp.]|nr:phospholipase D family protein [Variovorax sp.]
MTVAPPAPPAFLDARPAGRARAFPALWRRLALLLAALSLAACALPPRQGIAPSQALAPAEASATAIGQAVAARAAEQAPGASGIHPLADGIDAFAARMLLAAAAERTLDVQSYIWRDDTTGRLLLQALREAADRGVRVRLLLDDNGIPGLDARLAALDAHPGIEVRLFNPFATRWFKPLGFVTDFSRANRRMHNKSFSADAQATIIGGRNIGDEYFDALVEGLAFADLDVLAFGPAARDIASDFDRYWASESAWPIALLVKPGAPADLAPLDRIRAEVAADAGRRRYLRAVKGSDFAVDLRAGRLSLEWAAVQTLSDDPAKGQGAVARGDLMASGLARLLRGPRRDVELVSAYFVPGAEGVAALAALARQGVRVRILTNALEATDVAAVHAGYARRRAPLLAAGVELFEMRRQGGLPAAGANDRGGSGSGSGAFGSSDSSLHAKTFSVDRERVFIGSFNFDPRSAHLNTELGFVIDSPALASGIEDAFTRHIPAQSYAVKLDAQGRLYWLASTPDGVVRHDTEPGTTWWRRAGVGLMSLLPIEWLL